MASFYGENTKKERKKNQSRPMQPFIPVSYAPSLDPMHRCRVLRVIVVSYALSLGFYMSSLGSYALSLGSTHRRWFLHCGWGPECRLVGAFRTRALSSFALVLYLPWLRLNCRCGVRCRCDRFAAVAFESPPLRSNHRRGIRLAAEFCLPSSGPLRLLICWHWVLRVLTWFAQ